MRCWERDLGITLRLRSRSATVNLNHDNDKRAGVQLSGAANSSPSRVRLPRLLVNVTIGHKGEQNKEASGLS